MIHSVSQDSYFCIDSERVGVFSERTSVSTGGRRLGSTSKVTCLIADVDSVRMFILIFEKKKAVTWLHYHLTLTVLCSPLSLLFCFELLQCERAIYWSLVAISAGLTPLKPGRPSPYPCVKVKPRSLSERTSYSFSISVIPNIFQSNKLKQEKKMFLCQWHKCVSSARAQTEIAPFSNVMGAIH